VPHASAVTAAGAIEETELTAPAGIAGPMIRVTNGNANAPELAALTVVLMARIRASEPVSGSALPRSHRPAGRQADRFSGFATARSWRTTG